MSWPRNPARASNSFSLRLSIWAITATCFRNKVDVDQAVLPRTHSRISSRRMLLLREIPHPLVLRTDVCCRASHCLLTWILRESPAVSSNYPRAISRHAVRSFPGVQLCQQSASFLSNGDRESRNSSCMFFPCWIPSRYCCNFNRSASPDLFC